MSAPDNTPPDLLLGEAPLGLEGIHALASGQARPRIAASALERIRTSYELMRRGLNDAGLPENLVGEQGAAATECEEE